MHPRLLIASLVLLSAVFTAGDGYTADVDIWAREFPATDFAITAIDLDEIITDGPRRDTIPPIHQPRFVAAGDAPPDMGALEPVISLEINGDARAYPLRILLWHEIVNDVVGGVPVLVSYCPLCNSGVVYDRRLGDTVLSFGNTGRIRHFDMVMYDHQSESWWQQFVGEAIVGQQTGALLTAIPSRLESLERFRARHPDGRLLVPDSASARPYGTTPFAGMDRSRGRCAAAYPPPIRCPTASGRWTGWWWWVKRPGF